MKNSRECRKGPQWIWSEAGDGGEDIYRCFRRDFFLPAGKCGEKESGCFLRIAADSRFELYCNGRRVPASQYHDVPSHVVYEEVNLDSLLKPGHRNSLAVRVHYIGREFFTYAPGRPGLAAQLWQGTRLLLETDREWRWRKDPNYRDGLKDPVDGQLGFVFSYDARPDGTGNWLREKLSGWKPCWMEAEEKKETKKATAKTMRHPTVWAPRPVLPLEELPVVSSCIVQAGTFVRRRKTGSFAEMCQADFLRSFPLREIFCRELPPKKIPRISPEEPWTFRALQKGEDGYYLIVDLMREEAGLLTLDFSAGAGCVVEIGHGEHLDGGRIRMEMDGRHFCDRYVACEGKNHFVHSLRRIGGRYLELHFSHCGNVPVVLRQISLIPTELPMSDLLSSFSGSDSMDARLRSVAVRTLHLCMHEHYEDCVWREQALYGYDSRNQMLYGYYAWGNWKFAAENLRLMARSYLGNGVLPIIAPNRNPELLNIPSFTLVWISGLYENYLYGGDPEVLRHCGPVALDLLDHALASQTGKGLYRAVPSGITWNFVEWTPGLQCIEDPLQSPYNLYFYEALRSGAAISRALQDSRRAAVYDAAAGKLKKVIHQLFWTGEAYATLLPGKKFSGVENFPGSLPVLKKRALLPYPVSEHVQALALALQIAPANCRKKAAQYLLAHRGTPMEFNVFPYLIRGMMEVSPESREYVAEKLRSCYARQLEQGATSFWETSAGSQDFNGAGSLCHGWSAVHCFFLGAYVLGITPRDPGFHTFAVKIYPGTHLQASGTVPTPQGPIAVSWQLLNGKLQVHLSVPKGMTPVFEEYPEFPLGKVTVEEE